MNLLNRLERLERVLLPKREQMKADRAAQEQGTRPYRLFLDRCRPYRPAWIRRQYGIFSLADLITEAYWEWRGRPELKKLGVSQETIDNLFNGISDPTGWRPVKVEEVPAIPLPPEVPKHDPSKEASNNDWSSNLALQSKTQGSFVPNPGAFFKAQRKRDMFSAELARRTSGHSLESKPRKEQS